MRRLLIPIILAPMIALGQRMNHSLSASSLDAQSTPVAVRAYPDTIHVLAVMVQFQKDADTRTTGDGRFVTTASPADTTLDAPPHDAAYFRSHLLFLDNYYRRVSKGKVVVLATLLDSVVTLPSPMAAYSPAKNEPNTPVANLARDSWRAVDSLHLVPDFHPYRCFVVFHAGAGRDVDLVSQLGYDPTPLDIPSLYLGLNAFQSSYGTSYQGIPVQNGAVLITNTIVVPETESRLLPGVSGDVLLELGTNGLLCASLGNFLGLPDLFNTATGASGIGRFGLMDGQAIFSYSGAFPPEPSAWEKYWLGWIQPVEIPPGQTAISLAAVSLSDTVYRVPISSDEYFLLENRSRDPYRTGVTITSQLTGTTRQQTFTRDVAGFDAFDISGLAGVVTDVTVPDWSLPGATDPDGTFYDGGMLIWHIDEAVIARGLSTNSVNADPTRRGVNLVEADGSQDIGQQYGELTSGAGSEQGTPLDFWFQGNIAPVYKNAFSSATIPDSRSNSGANSHITIRDFSQRAPRMSVVIERGDATIRPLSGSPKKLAQTLAEQPLTLAPLGTGGEALLVATRGVHMPLQQPSDSVTPPQPGRLYAWTSAGTPAFPAGQPTGMIAQAQLDQDFSSGPVVTDMNGDGIPEIILPVRSQSGQESELRVYTARDIAPADGLLDLVVTIPLDRPVLASPVFGDSLLLVGDTGGKVRVINAAGVVVDSLRAYRDTLSVTSGICKLPGHGAFLVAAQDGNLTILTRSASGAKTSADRSLKIAHPLAGAPAAAMVGQVPLIAVGTTDGLLYLLDTTLTVQPGFPVAAGESIEGSPAWADMDGDGIRDIIVTSGNRIGVFNRAGVSLAGFPATVRAAMPIASSPVVGDVDGDGAAEIIVATGDGIVTAVNRQARVVSGFPLAAGRGRQTLALFDVPAAAGSAAFRALAVASSGDGAVNVWATPGAVQGPAPAVRPWPQYQHDARRTGLEETVLPAGAPIAGSFFPKDRAYNWPNPVYEGKTFIRYYVGEDAAVKIRIFTLAGDLVRELTGPGVGGLDNEVSWDVSGVQSGVYLARIEATAAGKSAVEIVKIAVVK